MALPKNMDAFTTALHKLPQKKIAYVISMLLIVYIALVFAKMTWRVVPDASISNTHVSSITKSNSQKNKNSTVDVVKLNALNLFGLYNKKAPVENNVEIVKDAPQTRLKLTLSGVTASDEPKLSAAIIEHSGTQETYGIGDMITGTRATLEQVLADRVLIRVSGQMETLMIDGGDFNQPAKTVVESNNQISKRESAQNQTINQQSNVVDQRFDKNLSAKAKKLRNDLQNDPGKITDYLKVSPKRENGKIVGYLLRPGKDPEFFKLSGLKAGDVAVNMNGYDLIQPSEAVQAMSSLQNVQNISLLVNRKGDFMEILFSID
jgi:general secretion pathway protein C